MAATITTQQLTGIQQRKFADLIYDRTGIRIPDQKTMLLSNRIKRRLRAVKMDCFDAYFDHIKSLPKKAEEWEAFLQEITTHETYLFRDESHWKWFSETYLKNVQSSKIRIWSAACSTGDEVYTIATCISDLARTNRSTEFNIVGTDIGVGAVEQARAATFGRRAIAKVPDRLKKTCFTQVGDELWQANTTLQKMVNIQQHNLMDPFRVPPFDLIFVKNVLIYFDPKSKQKVLANIDTALKPGGFLVTGPAEGVSEQLRSYKRIHPWLHQKPA